jgi:phenylacetate-CoA ligase
MIKKNIFLLLKRLKGTYAEYKEIQRYFNQIVECLNDESTMLTFQKDHLQKLLLHAYQNVPFYTQRIKKMIRNDHDIDINEFYKIDLLKKKDVRNYKDELISGDIGARKWFYNTSGGSTGEPVVLIQDELCNRWGAASDKFYYERIIGIDEMAVKKVILWGSEIDIFRTTVSLKAKIVNWLRNQKILNSFRMSEKDMEKYTKIINSYKPDLIRAYAGSLYELCKFIEKRRISIHRPKVIVTSAEKLSGAMREKIESVFGTKVYDF